MKISLAVALVLGFTFISCNEISPTDNPANQRTTNEIIGEPLIDGLPLMKRKT